MVLIFEDIHFSFAFGVYFRQEIASSLDIRDTEYILDGSQTAKDKCELSDCVQFYELRTESVQCREEGCIRKYTPEDQEISQGREFCTPRPERLPEGEAPGQS